MPMSKRILMLMLLLLPACGLSACGSGPILPPPRPLLGKSDADVTARRESLNINKAAIGPDGSLLYAYRREQEADLRNWSAKPVKRSVSGGLWVKQADKEPTELLAADYVKISSSFVWLDARRVVWLEQGGGELTVLDVPMGERKVLYRGSGLDQLQRHGNRLYFFDREEASSQYRLVSLDPTGDIKTQPLPGGVYIYPRSLQILDAGTAVVTMAKAVTDTGKYRIATSVVPPRFDSFVFSLGDNRSEKIPAALDLGGSATVLLAPDKRSVLLQSYTPGSVQGSVFAYAGTETFSFKGQGQWLDNGQLLVLDDRGLSRYDADGQKLHSLAQSGCTNLQSLPQAQALVFCQADSQARLYRYSDGVLELLHSLSPSAANFVFDPRGGDWQ